MSKIVIRAITIAAVVAVAAIGLSVGAAADCWGNAICE